jgi:hypothetical protein
MTGALAAASGRRARRGSARARPPRPVRPGGTSALRHLFTNRWLWAIAFSVVLQAAVVNLGLLNAAFGTTPLSLGDLFACVALASLVLRADEAKKLIRGWADRGQ